MLKGQMNELKHQRLENVELFGVLCCIRNMPKAVFFGVWVEFQFLPSSLHLVTCSYCLYCTNCGTYFAKTRGTEFP